MYIFQVYYGRERVCYWTHHTVLLYTRYEERPKKLLDQLRDIIQIMRGDRGIQGDSANGLSFSCLTPTKHLNLMKEYMGDRLLSPTD